MLVFVVLPVLSVVTLGLLALGLLLTVGCAAGRLVTIGARLVAPLFFTADVLLQALMSKVDTASVNGKAINERVRDDTIDMIVAIS